MNIFFKSKKLQFITVFSFIIAFASCKQTKENEQSMKKDNILLLEWSGEYGGTPAFDKMNIEDIKPAFEKGMEEKLSEIDAITNNTETPTFENTIVPLEKSGQTLDRIFTYYGIWSSNMSSPEFRTIESEMAPILSEFNSKISQNLELFKRIKTVYDNSLETPLEEDQQRVVHLIYENFAMNGAELDEAKKERYTTINKELSTLYTNFSNNNFSGGGGETNNLGVVPSSTVYSVFDNNIITVCLI